MSTTQNTDIIVRELAESFVEGVWDLDGLVARGEQTLGRRPRWLRHLARRLLAAFNAGPRPRAGQITRFIHRDRGFSRVRERYEFTMEWSRRPPPVMSPGPGAPGSWPVPAIVTPEDLAARLGLTRSELDWFADPQAREGRNTAEKLRHYHYRWQAKRSGSARLIEAPKPRLKAIQRRLLDEIIAKVPAHDAAHGFRVGRSVRTYIEPHIGRPLVLKMDLRDFFPSISSAWITALFLTAGYPEPVARRLSGLCTNSVPPEVWADPRCPIQGPEHWRLRRLHRQAHLPQGAPTSPALANLCAYRFDCRLQALAAATEARYTRYADDLAFSGDHRFARAVERFQIQVGAIALEEGFAVQPRKTRAMRQAVRQRVAGVVLNVRPNLPRPEFDRLKATLNNCIKFGPHSQNRDQHADFPAHLRGRIAYVAALNPERGQRLRGMFDRIAW
ncbi:RNA-directed DNA polymerase [Singulisphaera sp. GP187]|uniref:reverse transcriptase family protein n=1 Tax=Singulisphaera sp. GP187 TaxID=1882752 RepID=UPI0009274F46|nr:reverse transcriptase family protein [Singulisphaera sp. GP187]SIO24329.1 RNA-directed DNA polymerase [Singulisphaera sp. GP187]